MRNNFFDCLDIILKHEGGFVDHPKDPGGATNKGVTHKTYSQFLGRPLNGVEELKQIPDGHVMAIYKTGYWDTVRGDELPSGVDLAVFDWSVNSGHRRASRALQKVVGASPDGIIGPRTVAAVLCTDPTAIIKEFDEIRVDFYKSLNTFETFGRGWLKRAEETRDTALKMV